MNDIALRKRSTETVNLPFTLSQDVLNEAFPTGATVASSPSGLTFGTVAPTADGVLVPCSAGSAGVSYAVTATITLSDGRTVTDLAAVVVANTAMPADVVLVVDGEAPLYYFTNIAALRRKLGSMSLKSLLDNDQSGAANPDEQDILLEICAYASEYVRGFCNQYDYAQLELSRVVKKWTTIVACRELASQRMNPVPGSLEQAFLETNELLQMVQNGQYLIPDIEQALEYGPVGSSMRIDPAYPVSGLRVVKANSMDAHSTRKRKYDSSGWINDTFLD